MRVVMFVVLLIAIGCSKREPSPLNIEITQSDPNRTPEAKPNTVIPPDLLKPPPPNSLLKLDFVQLWEQTGPKRLPIEEQERLFHGRVVYVDHPDECFMAQLFGGGLGGPITAYTRFRVQSDVLKRVRAAVETPPTRQPTGGLLGIGEIGTRRLTLISVVEKQPQARERFRDFVQEGVVPVVAKASGKPTRLETRHGVVSVTRIPFKTPDRNGTIAVALVFPNTDPKELDDLIPPGDVVGRSLVGHRDTETLLIALVEEQ